MSLRQTSPSSGSDTGATSFASGSGLGAIQVRRRSPAQSARITTEIGLLRHTGTHSSERLYSCSLCEKS